MKTPGEIFQDIVCNFGTPVHSCACGLTHYDSSGEFMDDGELEDLVSKANASPDKYRAHEGGVSLGEWGGQSYVWNCECGWGDKGAETLTILRTTILQFYQALAEEQRKESNETMDKLKAIGSK